MEFEDRTSNSLRIGLTGGFGTGKSTVAGIFRELGAYIIDADRLARERLRKGTEEYRQVLALFGDTIVDDKGRIDRKALADTVFGDSRILARLNRIVHPAVIRKIEEGLDGAREPVRIAVIPLLFETGLEGDFDYLIVVTADRETVNRRVREKRKMSEEEIERRRAAQFPLSEKAKRADFIIDNSGSIEQTREEVKKIWERLTGN